MSGLGLLNGRGVVFCILVFAVANSSVGSAQEPARSEVQGGVFQPHSTRDVFRDLPNAFYVPSRLSRSGIVIRSTANAISATKQDRPQDSSEPQRGTFSVLAGPGRHRAPDSDARIAPPRRFIPKSTAEPIAQSDPAQFGIQHAVYSVAETENESESENTDGVAEDAALQPEEYSDPFADVEPIQPATSIADANVTLENSSTQTNSVTDTSAAAASMPPRDLPNTDRAERLPVADEFPPTALDQNLTQSAPVQSSALPLDPGSQIGEVITAEFVAQIENQIKDNPQLPDEQRRAVLIVYSRAKDELTAADQTRLECQTIQAAIVDLRKQVHATSDFLDATEKQEQLVPPSDASIESLHQQRDTYQEHLRQVQDRIQTLGEKLVSARGRVVDAEKRLYETPLTPIEIPDDATIEMKRALATNQTAITNHHDVARQKLSLVLERERLKLKLLETQNVIATAESKQLEGVLSDWRSAILAKESATAKQFVQETKRQTQVAHEELRRFAEKNESLAARNVAVAKELIQVRDEHEETAKLYKEFSDDFDSIRERASHGLTNTLGLLMRNRRQHLPNIRAYKRRLRDIRNQMESISNEQMVLEDQLHRLDRFSENVSRAVSDAVASDSGANVMAIETSAEQIVAARRELLTESVARLGKFTDALDVLGDDTHHLITVSSDYGQFIDGQVLWIRSTKPLDVETFTSVSGAVEEISDPRQWLGLGDALVKTAQEHIVITAFIVMLVLIIGLCGFWIRNRVVALGETVKTDRSVRGLFATMEALFWTVLVALPRSLALYFLGWLMLSATDASHLAITLGESLQVGALLLVSLEFLRQICRPGGLGETHFRWDETGLRKMHRLMPTMMCIGIPMVVCVMFLTYFEGGAWKDSLGRILFIVGMVLLLLLFRRILHPRTGALRAIIGSSAAEWTSRQRQPVDGSKPDNAWAARFGWLWFAIGNVAPVALAGLAGWGYFYTAEHLAGCLETTFWLILVLMIAHAMLGRCIDTLRDTVLSSLSLQQLGRLAIGTADRANGFQVDSEEVEALDNTREIRQILNIATCVMLLVGTWHIWSRVLPAVNVVTNVSLWTITKDVPVSDAVASSSTAEPAADFAGQPQEDLPVATRRVRVPITIGDVLRVLVILTVTLFAVKNVPGLFENFILSQLPIDRGAKHAVSTIMVYAMSCFGGALALRSIGIGWDSVQWLVAAMSVGLGFGLQEIFANVVSGLIILFERPIRIGDFITIGGETGHVTRIRFRATTVKDLDRREIVVPNKKFVTDEVINWTLSDPVTRLIVPLGVAYGTDTIRTRRLLEEVAAAHPIVLDEPRPTAVMKAFGDSTLDFELRMFIPRREEFAEIQHDVMIAIDQRFKEEHIEIAFPQCDLNIKSIEKVMDSVKERLPRAA